jgi:hypothetical protein
MQALAVPGHGPLDVLAEVVPQAPAVGDLDCLWCPAGAAVGIAIRPVPADHFRPRAGGQPGSEGVGGAFCQDVHRAAGGHIHQHGPVTMAAAQRELIHPKHLRGAGYGGIR